ncbi:hypothetical protein KQI61_05830 [Anaerocolumna aminovalerica]|uniref:hypothetical protein n=1 Tax=Anaerocolumna aminovalerica TaxID=1527 RepID=UPI001C0EC59C|nr:hypothetical protein [Anaerocolumna aminovalerica]MBU5331709.1 hypothetical protein [Anaerocolumna aminovalerica]
MNILDYNFDNKEDYTYEIIESLEEYYKDDIQTLLYCIKYLYLSTENYNCLLKLEEICKNNNLCPKCFSSNIAITTDFDNHIEYCGIQCKEPIYNSICNNCGFKMY